MKPADLAALIAIRSFAFQSIDNLSIKMSREEVKAVQNKIPFLDKKIMEGIIKLDVSLDPPTPVKVESNTVSETKKQ